MSDLLCRLLLCLISDVCDVTQECVTVVGYNVVLWLVHNTTLVQRCAASMLRNDAGIELEFIQALRRVDAGSSQ